MTIVERIANDKELLKMNEEIRQKTGKYVSYHYSKYSTFEKYKEDVQRIYDKIPKHEVE